eukprot:scaffold113691_cov27-Phaeocystis_antarctica.AAC.1
MQGGVAHLHAHHIAAGFNEGAPACVVGAVAQGDVDRHQGRVPVGRHLCCVGCGIVADDQGVPARAVGLHGVQVHHPLLDLRYGVERVALALAVGRRVELARAEHRLHLRHQSLALARMGAVSCTMPPCMPACLVSCTMPPPCSEAASGPA